MMLGYPFDEVVKLFDEIADLPANKRQRDSRKTRGNLNLHHHSRGRNMVTKEIPTGTAV